MITIWNRKVANNIRYRYRLMDHNRGARRGRTGLSTAISKPSFLAMKNQHIWQYK